MKTISLSDDSHVSIPVIAANGTFPFHQIIRIGDKCSANTVTLLMKSYDKVVKGAKTFAR